MTSMSGLDVLLSRLGQSDEYPKFTVYFYLNALLFKTLRFVLFITISPNIYDIY